MTDGFMPIGGEPVDEADLKVPKALQTAKATAGHPYFKLLECRRIVETGDETLVMDVDVETCQKLIYDIRSNERIAITFSLTDGEPEVTALRDDFPTNVPHRKLSLSERPVGLCLYEEPYVESRLHWTPRLFLEGVRDWLARTARNETHLRDQPLEPLLGGAPIRLIVPSGLLTSPETAEPLIIRGVDGGEGRVTFIAEWISRTRATREDFKFLVLGISVEPQVHGVIHVQPATIADLRLFLATAGVDLMGYLRGQLIALKDSEKYRDLLVRNAESRSQKADI